MACCLSLAPCSLTNLKVITTVYNLKPKETKSSLKYEMVDGMLMPDTVEHLEQVEEVVQDIYGHVIKIPLQRVADIETGHRRLEVESLIADGERASLLNQVASLERSNVRL
ncbi:hypothetical protein Tco_0226081 [Tanacetum coccineum]